MSLNSGKGRLLRAIRDLHVKWERVREQWSDPVVIDFEREFVDELDTHVRTAAAAMEDMEELLVRARRDCG